VRSDRDDEPLLARARPSRDLDLDAAQRRPAGEGDVGVGQAGGGEAGDEQVCQRDATEVGGRRGQLARHDGHPGAGGEPDTERPVEHERVDRAPPTFA
jgi:hypothetical protein